MAKGKIRSAAPKPFAMVLFWGDMFIFGGVDTFIETWSIYFRLPTPAPLYKCRQVEMA